MLRPLLLAYAAAAAADQYTQFLEAVAATAARRAAPIVNLSSITVRPRAIGAPPPTPTVLMHGLGDSGSNAGMESLAQSVMTAHPGAYAVAVNVANGLFSFITPIRNQIDEFARTVRADPKLAEGFNVVGLSQGGLVIRGYVELYNDPPVKNLISICGIMNGEYSCPLELDLIPFLCDIFSTDPYRFLLNGSIPLSFSDYWVTFYDRDEYLTNNQCLPALNNEVLTANSSAYKARIASLANIVLSEALNDTVVFPHESESFGGWEWTNSTFEQSPQVIYDFTNPAQSPQWQGDLLSLRSRYETAPNTLVFSTFEGDHIRFSDAYWDDVIIPYCQ